MFKRVVPLLYLEAGSTWRSDAIDLGGDNALRVEGILVSSGGTITSANAVSVAVEVSSDNVNWSDASPAISFDLEADPSYGTADSGTSKILSRRVRLKLSGSTTGDNVVSAWINTSRNG